MPSQKPTERPQSHARQQGYRDTTRHANAAQRVTEGARSHAGKTTERPTRSSTAARMGLFSFTFRFTLVSNGECVFFERDFSPFLEKPLSASFLKKSFLLFLLNPSCFLSRFLRCHRVEAHQLPRNQDNAVALLPGLLLHREGCSA